MATVTSRDIVDQVIDNNGWGDPGDPPVMRIWQYEQRGKPRWSLIFVQADQDALLSRYPDARLLWEHASLGERHDLGYLSELPPEIEVPARGAFLIPATFAPERDVQLRQLLALPGIALEQTPFGPMIEILPDAMTREGTKWAKEGFAEFVRKNRRMMGLISVNDPYANIDDMLAQHKSLEDVALQQMDRTAYDNDLELYRALWLSRNAMMQVIPELFMKDPRHRMADELYALEPVAEEEGLPQELPAGDYYAVPNPFGVGQDFIGVQQTGEQGLEALEAFLQKVRENKQLTRQFEEKLPETIYPAERLYGELQRDQKMYRRIFGDEWTDRALALYQRLFETAQAIEAVDASWLANRPADTHTLLYTQDRVVPGMEEVDLSGRIMEPTEEQLEDFVEAAKADPMRQKELREHLVGPLMTLLSPEYYKEGRTEEGVWGDLGLTPFKVSRMRSSLEYIVERFPEIADIPEEITERERAVGPGQKLGYRTAVYVLPIMLTQMEFEDLFGRIHEGHDRKEVMERLVGRLKGRERRYEDMEAIGQDAGIEVAFADGTSGTIPWPRVAEGLSELYKRRIEMDLPAPHPRPDIDLPAAAQLPGVPSAPVLEPGAPAFDEPALPPGVEPGYELPPGAPPIIEPGPPALPPTEPGYELPMRPPPIEPGPLPELPEGEDPRLLEGVWGWY